MLAYLDQAEDALLDDLRSVELGPHQLHEVVDELLLAHERFEPLIAVLHASLQHGQRVHYNGVVLADLRLKALADGSDSISTAKTWK